MDIAQINELSHRVLGAAIKVHKALGPGFTERIYANAVAYEFEEQQVQFTREHVIKVKYEGKSVGDHRLDFLIEDELVLEIKSVYEINNFHMAQILSYLRATNKKLGLILNFSRPKLQIKRVANGL